MKKLILLSYLTPILAFADEIDPSSPDAIIKMLANALALGKSLPPTIGAIFVGIVALAIAVMLIARYFFERGKREKDAYLLDQKIRTEQTENLARMQKDASTGLINNMDINYKQDYEYFVKKIKEEKYDSVYVKIAPKFHTSLAEFIYNKELSAEERSARVIIIIRPQ